MDAPAAVEYLLHNSLVTQIITFNANANANVKLLKVRACDSDYVLLRNVTI